MSSFFHVSIGDGLYLISSVASGTSMEFGPPTANSYLIVGREKALLFDLAVNEPGIRDYIKTITDRPLTVVLSHGHPDHIYHLRDFSQVWMHEADENFPLCLNPGLKLLKRKLTIHQLRQGDTIDLAGRVLTVFHIPGHTMGSILLLDEQTGTLFSGDTVARRVLYGITGCPPLSEFEEMLLHLPTDRIHKIYSAHDRGAIEPEYIGHMIRLMREELPKTEKYWHFPGFPKMRNLVYGEESTPDFFDIAVPEAVLDCEGESCRPK